MAYIATWLTFSIVITILSSVIAGVMVPLAAGDFRVPTEDGRFQVTPEFREAMQKRMAVTNNIQKISPTNLYQEAASDILGVAGGFMRGMGFQQFQRTLTLGEALAAHLVVWLDDELVDEGLDGLDREIRCGLVILDPHLRILPKGGLGGAHRRRFDCLKPLHEIGLHSSPGEPFRCVAVDPGVGALPAWDKSVYKH